MRGFLWCHGSMRRGMAKVAWEDVCLPKEEGGIGIRRLGTFNQALKQVWSRVKDLAGLPKSVPSIDDFAMNIAPIAKNDSKSFSGIVLLWLRLLISFGRSVMVVFSKSPSSRLAK
ncbi:hypothetical protein Tco_0329260 [Tanacetum coccineum]